jgi:hypothetical protein
MHGYNYVYSFSIFLVKSIIDHFWSFPVWIQFPCNCYSAIKPWHTNFVLVVLHLAITLHVRAIKVKMPLEFLSSINFISSIADRNKTKNNVLAISTVSLNKIKLWW